MTEAKKPRKNDKVKKPIGRPSEFNQQTADYICEQLALGRSLAKITKDDGMPSYSTVARWLLARDDFRDSYVRAREVQADVIAEEILSISDDGLNDTYEDDEGNPRTNHDVIARSRLRVDARKWYLSKVMPKKYGERTDINVGGQEGNPLTLLLSSLSGNVLGAKK